MLSQIIVGVVVFIITLFFMILWDTIKLNKLRKKYNEEKDKSRRTGGGIGGGTESTGGETGTHFYSQGGTKVTEPDKPITTTESDSARSPTTQERELLSSTTATPIRKDSTSKRKASKGNRGFYGKLRR